MLMVGEILVKFLLFLYDKNNFDPFYLEVHLLVLICFPLFNTIYHMKKICSFFSSPTIRLSFELRQIQEVFHVTKSWMVPLGLICGGVNCIKQPFCILKML